MVVKVTTINNNISFKTPLNSKGNTITEKDNNNNKQIDTTTTYTKHKLWQKKKYDFGVWTETQIN